MIKRIAILQALMAVGAFTCVPALGAGMDCQRAKTPTETAICAHPDLHKLDGVLGTTYDGLSAAQPKQRAALRSTQRQWLGVRDTCVADHDCILQAYDDRIAKLRRQLRDAEAYNPDKTDRLALQDLRAAVEAQQRTDPEFPVEKALKALTITKKETTFANVDDPDGISDQASFPKERPDGVTEDEWRALVASNVEETSGERGQAAYSLVDIDGDGKRDLIVDWYAGGTGLWSYVYTLRREGSRFVLMQGGQSPVGFDSNLYGLNGRGSNQDANWIRLRGRMYVAYTSNHFGVSDVFLLNPLSNNGDAPKLTVRYRYRLSVPKTQRIGPKGVETTMSDELHGALTRALAQVDLEPAGSVQTQDASDSRKPLCPIPANAKDDERELYYSYGPGHYTYEDLGDMPINVGSRCYIGRLVDWFGGYSPDGGLTAEIWMRAPDEGIENPQEFAVDGRRSVIGVDTSIAPFDGDPVS